jgi:hypothetical protein
MTDGPPLRGRVTYRGEGQADAEVLALGSDGGVLAAAATDDGGGFSVAPPETPAVEGLFARCRGPVAGVATQAVDPAASSDVELRMDDHGPAWPLVIRVDGGEPLPHQPYVRLMPLAIGDIPPELMRAVLARVGDVQHSALESRPMAAGALERQVQAGRWWFRIDLSEAWEARPKNAEDGTRSWVVEEARSEDGAQLAALHGGHEVAVEGPTTVLIRLTQVG